MKLIKKLPIILSLEKDDSKNFTGMQLRVWVADNRTTIYVRLFKHSDLAVKNLWDGKRTLMEVDNLILEFLQDLRLIKSVENWDYSVEMANDFDKQDLFEEKEQCVYFAWHVKRHLIDKF
jgi:hypothetical protein